MYMERLHGRKGMQRRVILRQPLLNLQWDLGAVLVIADVTKNVTIGAVV